MSRGFQRVIATGHLGDAPTIKAPQNGGLVAELRIAVTESYRDRAGKTTQHTEWIRAKCFGRTAEIAQQYLFKGRLVTIEGKLHTEKWQASDGSDRYSTWIYLSPGGLTLHGSNEHERTRAEHQARTPAPTPPQDAPIDDWGDDDIRF